MASVNRFLPKTWSMSLTEDVTATHDFTVTNYSLLDGMGHGKYISSSTFNVDGHDWFLQFFPDGFDNEAFGYVSLCLNLRRRGRDVTHVSVRTKCNLSLLDKDGKVSQLANYTRRDTFSPKTVMWGYRKFLKKSVLESSSCLNNDCLTIRCVLSVIKLSRTIDIKIISQIIEPQFNLHRDLECLLKGGKGADVKFSVGGRSFRAHRCVLASRSPVFDAEFFGGMKEKVSECIEIHDMDAATFEVLLHFIYTDSLPENGDCMREGETAAAMQQLLVAADRYGLDGLRLICERKLCQSLEVETVATTLVLADRHYCKQLKEACIEIMASSAVFGAVMATDGYKQLVASCPEVLMDILDKKYALMVGN